jgi:hypothetical protein
MGMPAMNGLVEKVTKRIPPWKGKHMSSGGMMILSNSCLASLPTYTMDFYLLNQGTHKKMDSIRAKFFLRGANDAFKYHMVKWKIVCRPKEFGGAGIVNTQNLQRMLDDQMDLENLQTER